MEKISHYLAVGAIAVVLVSLNGCISIKKEVEEAPATTTTTTIKTPASSSSATVERTTTYQ